MDGRGRLIGVVTDRDLRSVMSGPALAEYLPAEQGSRLREAVLRRAPVPVFMIREPHTVEAAPAAREESVR